MPMAQGSWRSLRAGIAETRDRAIETLRAGFETRTPPSAIKARRGAAIGVLGTEAIGDEYDTVNTHPPTKCNFHNRAS